MITLKSHRFNVTKCKASLKKFESLLKTPNIDETKLLRFFARNSDLISLIGMWHSSFNKNILYQKEAGIVNEFRADFTITDSDKRKFLLIEFEEGKQHSVFRPRKGKTAVSHEWSPKFEHGYSQVVDWYYRIDDLERSNKLKENFGSNAVDFVGLLIVGRKAYLERNHLMNRLHWRKKKTLIDSKPLNCITFDELYDEMKEKLATIIADRSGKIL